MAGLSDVTTALGKLAEAALYPGQNPPSGNSVAGVPVLIQSGWPDPQSLQAMIAARKAQVTVYPQPTERNVSRYARTWSVGPKLAATFTLTQNSQQITVAGSQPGGTFYQQNIAVFANGKVYIFSPSQSDGPSAIAAGLVALVQADFPSASAAGAVITLPDTARIGALRVGTGAYASQEAKRQDRQFQIVVWAASIAARDAVANLIDVAIGLTDWLTFADSSRGRMLYKGSPYTDFDQKQGIFRRDFLVSVEYPTINTVFAPEVIAFGTEFFINSDNPRLATEGGTLIQDDGGFSFILTDPDRSTFT